MNEIDESTRKYLDHVLESFSPGICYACAYGSGVFKQSGHKSTKDNMIDFIFVVRNAFSWHLKNLAVRNHHYSFLKNFSPNTVATIQNNFGAKVFFNTRIDFDNRMIKYGVIEVSDFIEDLLHWETLYIAGRLHKPVVSLKGLDDPEILNAFNSNLQSALNTSLLLLPEAFTEEELYMQIAALSYTGDFRMIVGEDKNKVKNIVKPNLEKFHDLYVGHLLKHTSLTKNNDLFYQDLNPCIQIQYLGNLPKHLKRNIFTTIDVVKHSEMLVENRNDMNKTVLKGVSKIVRKSSSSQTVKGIFTAGVSKSVLYSVEKLIKMIKSIIK